MQRSADDRIQLWLIRLMQLSLIGAAVWLGFQREWSALGITVLAIILTQLPRWLERRFQVTFPIEFSLVIVLFTYLSTFLGEVGDAYERFWWWDGVLHMASGVVFGFGGFLVLYTLYVQAKLQASPFIIVFFAVCFAIAAGAVWEIFEFVMDQTFGTNMQKNGLDDTMYDLIVDSIGAVFLGWLAYRFMQRGERSFVSELIKDFLRRNPRFKEKL